LPKYRGAAPIQWAILNNETLTGLTVMQMDEGLDTGPILDRTEVPILPDETSGSLHDRLALKAGEVMVKWLRDTTGHCIQGRPQDQAKSTYAPKIERELARVDWQKPAEVVNALIRGLDPKPGAYTTLGGQELKLFASKVQDTQTPGHIPGRVAENQAEGLVVETAQGMVVIREVQYPGKKKMGAIEFLRGFAVPAGTLLGR
jgi:methionyl-tRNA formyltransferase